MGKRSIHSLTHSFVHPRRFLETPLEPASVLRSMAKDLKVTHVCPEGGHRLGEKRTQQQVLKMHSNQGPWGSWGGPNPPGRVRDGLTPKGHEDGALCVSTSSAARERGGHPLQRRHGPWKHLPCGGECVRRQS